WAMPARRAFSIGALPRKGLNRPISAYFSGWLSFLVSARILTIRLARRSRRRRVGLSAILRRYISRTCWATVNESIRLDKSARGIGPEEMVRDGAPSVWDGKVPSETRAGDPVG